jgi:Glycosyltransferase family 87
MYRLSRFALLICGFVVLITSYAVLIISYVRIPEKLAGADFLMFYSVGRVARQYGFNQVYNLNLATIAQAQIADIPPGTWQTFLPNHPPFLYPLLGLLAALDYQIAYFGYFLLLVFVAAAGLPVLYRVLRRNNWPIKQAWIMMAGVILFEPLFISILKGQDSAVLLLGGLVWFSGLVMVDDRMAGLGLSLTLIRPQIALLMAIPFLFRQRKVFLWFCGGGLVLGLYSFSLVGWTGTRDFLHLLTLTAVGAGYGLAEAGMFDLVGLVFRLAPVASIDLAHGLGWGVFVVALVSLCFVWGLARSISYRQIALAVALSLLAAPHLHYHDLAILIIPIICLGMAGVSSTRIKIHFVAALPVTISLLLLFAEFWDPLRFTIPYLLMIGLPACVWKVENSDAAG